MANKIRPYSRRLDDVFVDTLILLTDDKARVRIHDEQADRVLHVREALKRLDDPEQLPVRSRDLTPLYPMVGEAMSLTRPSTLVQQIGLYDVVQKVDQDDRFTLLLARHQFIETKPMTVLKVYHFDVYASEEDMQYRIQEIFLGQDTMRLLGSHPNLVRTGDMFAWNDDSFVEPVEYLEFSHRLEVLLDTQPGEMISWTEKERIIKGMAAGLIHAHRLGVVIGLALKDALSNLASGVMILLFRPYTLNHQIDGSGTSGSVEEVGKFSTILHTPDNIKVIVPHSSMIKGNIKNYSAFETRWVDLVVKIGTEDIALTRDLLLQTVSTHPMALAEPVPIVVLLKVTESSVNLALRPWVLSENYNQARSELLELIKDQIVKVSIS